jgi:hypothetical protein
MVLPDEIKAGRRTQADQPSIAPASCKKKLILAFLHNQFNWGSLAERHNHAQVKDLVDLPRVDSFIVARGPGEINSGTGKGSGRMLCSGWNCSAGAPKTSPGG